MREFVLFMASNPQESLKRSPTAQVLVLFLDPLRHASLTFSLLCVARELAEGSAGFSLKPGEEYKFCWCLVVGREIQRVLAPRRSSGDLAHGALTPCGEKEGMQCEEAMPGTPNNQK